MGQDLFQKYNVSPTSNEGEDLFAKYGMTQPPASPSDWTPAGMAQMPGYVASLGRSAVQGLTNMGGNIIGDVGTGLSVLGAPNLGDRLQSIGNQAANVTPQQMGISNPDIGNRIVHGGVQALPYMAAASELPVEDLLSKLGAMPSMKSLIAPVLKGSAFGASYGATQSSPGDALSGGVIGGLVGAAGGLFPGAISAAPAIKNFITGSALQDEANSIYGDLAKGQTASGLNKTNTENIMTNYNAKKAAINQGYNQLNQDAVQSGYLPTGNKPIAGLYESSNQKFIDPSKDTADYLDNLSSKQDSDSPLKNISTGLKSAIEQYKSSPTFANAHTLQSLLGTESADFLNGISTDIADKQTAATLSSARNSLKDDIIDNFNKNGDTDLAERYKGLSDQYKNQIVPYMKVSQVWNAIRGKNYPANIIKTLSNDDDPGYNQVIRNDLQANPNQTAPVLAQALKNAAQPDAYGNIEINSPQKLIKSSNNMPDNIKQFMSPELTQRIQKLQDAQVARDKYAKPLSYLLNKIALGAAIGLGAGATYGGINKIREML
jgi:hypothetical protein